jgi:DNA-binding CsgD family transcriptional regulator
MTDAGMESAFGRWPLKRLATVSSAVLLAILEEAIDCVFAPLFLVARTGEILLANGPAKARLEADGEHLRRDLAHEAVLVSRRTANVRRAVSDSIDAVWILKADPPFDMDSCAALAARHWQLTARQCAVLRLMLDGLTNKRIAHALGSAEHTVEIHVTAVLRKASAHTRVELVARSMELAFRHRGAPPG